VIFTTFTKMGISSPWRVNRGGRKAGDGSGGGRELPARAREVLCPAGRRDLVIPFVDLDEGITFVKVDIVVVSWQP